MKNRLAMSLAELLVVMSACSMILTMSASLIHRAMRVESESRGFYDAERSAMRLARQLRDDVHRATTASIGTGDNVESTVLSLHFARGRSVEYVHSADNVMRILSRGDGGASREEFAFPAPVEVDVREEDSPRRIVLTITTAEDPSKARRTKPVDLHVEASLARVPAQEGQP